MLTATLVTAAEDAPLQRVFDAIADGARPAWQRSALLRGAEVTLLGAEAPGSVPRGRGRGAAPDVPCPTCPGGRAGPGGAAAFPNRGNRASQADDELAARAAGLPAARGRGRGAARPPVKLTREPALAGVAAAKSGDLSSRAAEVLRRLEWPGKPSTAAPVTPLTDAQQAQFAAGRTTYQNLCQPCHQADGRGADTLAPPLIGSEFALATDATIPVRIVLHGKEGTVALMPPLGSMLTDEQIAAVLTYIRREWGHTASPVSPADVARTRRETAARTRPWTIPELTQLLRGGR
jgi:mono/diheme cytochrome c family protein